MPIQGHPRPIAKKDRASTAARAVLCLTLGFLSLASAQPAGAADATGVADPVVSLGLTGIADWQTASPFLDVARTMRPFFAFAGSEWESMSHDDLRDAGHLDADGYPLRIPDGMSGLRTIWSWDPAVASETRKGIYILSYAGAATINLGGDAQIINQGAGRIIFENTSGSAFWLDVTATNAQNRFHALSIVRAEDYALTQAGAIFNPDWLALVADSRELRFMDWMQTNNSSLQSWNDYPLSTSASWATGVPVDIMVRLANEAGVDPWFTMPHQADDDFVRAFATQVRDTLDPRLKAHVEYSNEIWNAAFDQFHWLRDQAIADWGNDIADDWETIFAYHTKRASTTARIWQDVYGEAAKDRLVNVLGTQATFAWMTEVSLVAKAWQDRDPDAFIPPSDLFEELAATTYFGGSMIVEPDSRAELLRRARESGSGSHAWLYRQLALPDASVDSVPAILASISEQRELAHQNDLRFTLYEGGQHLHHSFAVEDLSEQQADALTDFLGGFVRSPEMAALYSLLWDGWQKIGDGPFMHYTEMSAPSRWGSWGLLAWPGDSTPRSRFLRAKQAEGGSWWGEGGGAQYLQGITASGSESADRMEGTVEEDYLAGLGGDDLFPASAGWDGINGGDGIDTYLLPGAPDAYSITAEDAGHRVDGPDGSAFLIHVEVVEFADGTRRQLD